MASLFKNFNFTKQLPLSNYDMRMRNYYNIISASGCVLHPLEVAQQHPKVYSEHVQHPSEVIQQHPKGVASGQVQHPWEVAQQHSKGVASEHALRGSPKAPQGCSEYAQHPWGVVQQHPKGVVSMCSTPERYSNSTPL